MFVIYRSVQVVCVCTNVHVVRGAPLPPLGGSKRISAEEGDEK